MMDGTQSDARRPLDGFDAAVWDLDGTLVRLPVDWDRVTRDVAAVFESAGHDVPGTDLWDLLQRADGTDLAQEVETTIADHERAEAIHAERLPYADAVGGFDAEGVCSLNCEDACRTALDVHGLTPHVDAVVGRDTVAARKPDPAPLLETIRRLGVDADDVVFVGDSPRDEEAARRADVAFRYVDDASLRR
ncbi:HAD family hydrolase [Halobellus rubicundus]|uniref:HAD family hydrolase n=1 Tax=Halobellus rubicundus TaxID=2996466 RepID=A0ABD5MG54_9EURY